MKEPPRIEFPCDYPIRIVGLNDDGYREHMLDVVERHAVVVGDPTAQASRGDRYTSLLVVIRATGQPQLEALHKDLLATGRVKLVL